MTINHRLSILVTDTILTQKDPASKTCTSLHPLHLSTHGYKHRSLHSLPMRWQKCLSGARVGRRLEDDILSRTVWVCWHTVRIDTGGSRWCVDSSEPWRFQIVSVCAPSLQLHISGIRMMLNVGGGQLCRGREGRRNAYADGIRNIFLFHSDSG